MYCFNFGLDSLNSLGLNMGIRKKNADNVIFNVLFFVLHLSV